MEAMSLRFRNLLQDRPDYADVLRAMKLLTAASIRPLTHQRLEVVLERIFGRSELHLRDCLRVLADQSFLQEHGLADGTARAEPAYLRDAVTYIEGKRPEDDFFPALAVALEGLGDAEALNGLGITCLLAGGWSAQAIWDCFDVATIVDPHYSSAWLNKTMLLSAGGYHDEAVEAAQRAVELKPNDYAYWQQKGTVLHNAKRHEEALDAYRRAAELNPDRPDTWRQLDQAYMDLGRPRDALSVFNRSIDLGADYDYVESWVGRAIALRRLGRVREALRTYGRVTDMDPDRFESWFNKAGLLRELGCWQEALLAMEEAEKLRPDHADVQNGKGEALFELAKRDDDNNRLQEAYQTYERATDLDEENATAWSMKGITLMYLGRYEEALKVIERSITLRPDRPEEWFHKAQALLKMVEGQPIPSSAEYTAGMWWLCRAWKARARFPDGGMAVLNIFEQIGHDPDLCVEEFPSLAWTR